MDRFSEQSPADLASNYRLNSRCFRDEDGLPDESMHVPESPEVETPSQPLCAIGRSIIESSDTVGEMVDRMKEHRPGCSMCGGAVQSSTRKAA